MRKTVVRIGVAAATVFAGMSGALTAQAATAPAPQATPLHQTPLHQTPLQRTVPAHRLVVRPAAPAPRFTTGTEYRVTAPMLNVRSGPGTNYQVVDGLGEGHLVHVQETQHNWSMVGPDQWVSASYLARPGATRSITHTVTHRVHYRHIRHHLVSQHSRAVVNSAWTQDFAPGESEIFEAVQDVPIFSGSRSTVGNTIVGHTMIGKRYRASKGVQGTPSGDYRYLGSGHWAGAEALNPVKRMKS